MEKTIVKQNFVQIPAKRVSVPRTKPKMHVLKLLLQRHPCPVSFLLNWIFLAKINPWNLSLKRISQSQNSSWDPESTTPVVSFGKNLVWCTKNLKAKIFLSWRPIKFPTQRKHRNFSDAKDSLPVKRWIIQAMVERSDQKELEVRTIFKVKNPQSLRTSSQLKHNKLNYQCNERNPNEIIV